VSALLYFLDKYHKRIEEYLLAQIDKKTSAASIASALDSPVPGNGTSATNTDGVSNGDKGRPASEDVHSVLEQLRKVLEASYPIVREVSPGKGNAMVARRLGDKLGHRRKHSQQFSRSIFSAEELREVGPIPLAEISSSPPNTSAPLTARSIRSTGSAIFPKPLSPFASAARPNATYAETDTHVKVICELCD